MYIKTDNDNNIIQLITTGFLPEENGYEIPNDIDVEIMKHIFDYKYINGEFVLKNANDNIKLIKLKKKKIENMSNTCNQLIEKGIDYNDEHYSLKTTDQINLSKLESIALTTSNKIFYHADNKQCREFSKEEIITIAQMCEGWITAQTTYFNFLKSYINSLNDIDTILNINYGDALPSAYQLQVDSILTTMGIPFTNVIVNDTFDYSYLINDVDVNNVNIQIHDPIINEDNTTTKMDPDILEMERIMSQQIMEEMENGD